MQLCHSGGQLRLCVASSSRTSDTSSIKMSTSLQELADTLGISTNKCDLHGTGDRRCLQATSAVFPDEVLCSVPWTSVLSIQGAMHCLAKTALLPSGVPHLLQQLHDKHELITEGTAWQLLLALHLLAEVLDPGSIWKHYIHSLPGPVLHGSSMSASEALMSPWVFFFNEVELGELQHEPLAAYIAGEQHRLTQLHQLLFNPPGTETVKVDVQTFVWVHCLVKSRAIDMAGASVMSDLNPAEAQTLSQHRTQLLEQCEPCMVPVIDMCNHKGSGGSCTLSWSTDRHGCRYVDLVAKQEHSTGDPLLLDYGDKPLHDMLLQYGFVPDTGSGDAITESFDDVGSCWGRLLVKSENLLGPVMLQEIDIGPNRQQGCLLPCSDQDRSHLLFVVGNSRFCAGGNMHAGVAVNNTELSRSPATMLTQNADVARCQSTSVWPKLEHMSRQLEPDQERTMCLYIAAQCLSLLEQFPTTIEQDQQLLQYICSTSTKLHHAPTEANNDDYRAESASIRAEHQQLGITYRLTRKKMLKAIVTDLQSMANLLDPT